jgi:hypothetical protein
MLYLSFEHLIFHTYLIESRLEYERHRIEKKWDIEDRISHREDFPSYSMWDEVAESDRGSRDDSEVERIKITPSLSSLEVVYEKCPNDPT